MPPSTSMKLSSFQKHSSLELSVAMNAVEQLFRLKKMATGYTSCSSRQIKMAMRLRIACMTILFHKSLISIATRFFCLLLMMILSLIMCILPPQLLLLLLAGTTLQSGEAQCRVLKAVSHFQAMSLLAKVSLRLSQWRV